jgi:hypothetical protein
LPSVFFAPLPERPVLVDAAAFRFNIINYKTQMIRSSSEKWAIMPCGRRCSRHMCLHPLNFGRLRTPEDRRPAMLAAFPVNSSIIATATTPTQIAGLGEE